MKLGDLRYFFIIVTCNDLSILHKDDVIGKTSELQSMGSHNDSLSFQIIQNSVFHKTSTHVDVHCAQYIIIQIDIVLGVE